MKFDVAEFKRFCCALQVETKELGVIPLGEHLSGTQEYFIEEVAKALNDGIHYLVVLKGRQVHCTTICLALDLYWSFKFGGVQGTLITDSDDNSQMFRETLTMYMESLPNEWKQPVITHNRTQLTFRNRSRFLYQVAGTKKKAKRSVGVGKAVMFLHATEVSNWGDEGALADIEASLAQQNPKRLYIFESTARGPNAFQDMWETAQRSRSQAAIFVGWWRNNFYRCKKGSPEYNVYWDGKVAHDEIAWVDEVKRLYDYDIDDEQLAWWRLELNEHQRDETMMMQNYPPTENYAFVMSGSQFFNSGKLSDRMKSARSLSGEPFRFIFGQAFEDTTLVDAAPERANFTIWEHPKPGSWYTIGADPAWGSSEWADRHCIQVYRCFADGMDQVAEFCTADGVTDQYAWALLYLAGAYSTPGHEALINLEINGPGMAVWSEIQTLKRLSGSPARNMNPQIQAVILNIQNHLYKRPDSLNANYNFHTKTTAGEKERYMNVLRDGFEGGTIIVRSTELVREMGNVVRTEGQLGAPGRGKDDRVIASALAAIAWKDRMQLRLAYANYTRKAAEQMGDKADQHLAPLARAVNGYLTAMKVPHGPGTVH